MTWWEYVQRVSRGATQVQIAQRTGIEQTSVSRWKRGTGGVRPDSVAAFARAYGRPVIEAYVAAGYLDEQDAAGHITLAADPAALRDEQLIAELERRLSERAKECGDQGSASTSEQAVRVHQTIGPNGETIVMATTGADSGPSLDVEWAAQEQARKMAQSDDTPTSPEIPNPKHSNG